MIRLLLIMVCFSVINLAAAQASPGETRIYIVRHAEKEAGKDPLLTPGGNKRAGDLMRALQHKGVEKIYVSQFRRTQNTGDSLRLQMQIDTAHYLADTLCDNLVSSIMAHSDFGKTILIIGHSNTIPQMIRKFGVSDYPYGDIPDGEYDNLFLITYRNGKARLKKMKFGDRSGMSAAMQ